MATHRGNGMPAKNDAVQAAKAGMPQTMRATVVRTYGTAADGALALETIATPAIKAGEVLVEVRAAGLSRGTWHLMTGKPYLMRLGFGLRGPKNPVVGQDVAGTVVAVGADVMRFAPGDEVFGVARGSFAEYAAALERKLARKPAALTFEEAAVMPISALTALQALRDSGRLKTGQHVLVIGASGGVGTFAVQIAKALGAEVTGVASAAKADLVRTVGADHVLDYDRDDFADGRRRYDLILDIGGRSSLRRLRRALTETGTLVLVGGEDGGALTGGMGRQLRALVLSMFSKQRLTMMLGKEDAADLEPLIELVATGQLTPAVDRTYPLSDAPLAMRRLEEGQVRGKVAITI